MPPAISLFSGLTANAYGRFAFYVFMDYRRKSGVGVALAIDSAPVVTMVTVAPVHRGPGRSHTPGETRPMIRLTHLSGEPFILNAELIRYVESRPDTFVTLTTGDRLIVKESMDDVLGRAVDYQRSKHLIPAPHRAPACAASDKPSLARRPIVEE